MHVTRTLRSSVLTKFEVLIKLVFQSGLRPRNRSRYRAASCRRRTWRPPPSTAGPGRVRAGIDRYRAWPLLIAPFAPSCRRARGPPEQAPTGARYSRALGRHSTRRRIERTAGAGGWLRRDRTKGWDERQKGLFPVLVTNSPQRGGYPKRMLRFEQARDQYGETHRQSGTNSISDPCQTTGGRDSFLFPFVRARAVGYRAVILAREPDHE